MLVRGPSLKSTLSQYLVDRIGLSPNIEVKMNCVLTRIEGGASLEKIRYRTLDTSQEIEVDTGWVFVCVGGEPRTKWTDAEQLARDAAGYILTGIDLLQKKAAPLPWPLERSPYPMEASIPGVFVAGDIRANSIKRCATAVGEGAAAVASVHRSLALAAAGAHVVIADINLKDAEAVVKEIAGPARHSVPMRRDQPRQGGSARTPSARF